MPINPKRILYKDEHLLAVLKLAGELTVAGKGEIKKLPLFDFLRTEFPGIHPLNRLDYETSGIVVFARTKGVLAQIVEGNFKGWKKMYRTIVAGTPKQSRGVITLPLPTRAHSEDAASLTRYSLLKSFERCAYMEVQIESGRRHQIRRHFAMIGHPVALDYEYGDKKFNNWFSQKYRYSKFFLHASLVEFPHPVTGQTVKIECPLPPAFEYVLKALKEESDGITAKIRRKA